MSDTPDVNPITNSWHLQRAQSNVGVPTRPVFAYSLQLTSDIHEPTRDEIEQAVRDSLDEAFGPRPFKWDEKMNVRIPLDDDEPELEAAHDPEGNGIFVRGVGWYSTTDFNRYFRVTRRDDDEPPLVLVGDDLVPVFDLDGEPTNGFTELVDEPELLYVEETTTTLDIDRDDFVALFVSSIEVDNALIGWSDYRSIEKLTGPAADLEYDAAMVLAGIVYDHVLVPLAEPD